MAKVFFQGREFNLPDGTTPEEAQASLETFHPEAANADYEEDADGNITFSVAAGTKG